jgi:hypothetical protein
MNNSAKVNLACLAVLAAMLGGCSKTETATTAESTAVTPEPETPAPAPKIVAVTPPPATPEATPAIYAPEGTYFLITGVSVETDGGITGLKPGMRVTKKADGKYLAGEHVVELQPQQVTNDLRVVQRLAEASKAQEAARQSQMEAATAEAARQEEATSAAAAASASGSGASSPGASASYGTSGGGKYVPGVTQSTQSGAQSSTSLGAGHTMTADGYQWQKSPDGKFWVPMRQLNGKPPVYPTPRYRPVR